MTQIIIGDNREELKKLPPNYFHCVVTSPPYYGQRDYGTAKWIDGDPDCLHTDCTLTLDLTEKCKNCGAIKEDKQIGNENSPEEYIDELLLVFREVQRTLREDGVLWIVIGDSYYNYRPGSGALEQQSISTSLRDLPQKCNRRANKHPTLKEKDLIGIPWMLAFALRTDGWYLRSVPIWLKNGIPESVKDRPTSTYETVLMLTKNPDYFFDYYSIQEPVTYKKDNGIHRFGGNKYGDNDDPHYQTKSGNPYIHRDLRRKRNVFKVAVQPFSGEHFAVFPYNLIDPMLKAGTSEIGCCSACGAPHIRDEELPHIYLPTCTCNAPTAPCRVLDPFAGSGTVGEWCYKNNRDCTLIDLNEKYKHYMEQKSHVKEQELTKTKNVLRFFE